MHCSHEISLTAARVAAERTGPSGLSSAEASARLVRFGPNELPRANRRGFARILAGVLSEPMFLLLVLAAIVYLVVGGLAEGLLMFGFAALSVGLVVVQEKRSENALAALRALAAPMARVLRDGREQRINAREVVPGDLLFMAEGDRVAADALLRRTENLSMDESLLTGESLPVAKHAADGSDGETCMVYANTLVASGRGLAQAVATGATTEAGRIGVSLAAIEVEPTRLQKSFGHLIRLFAFFAVAASLALVLLYGLLRGDWLQGLLSGIALGMSALPEEFPMVLAVFVALGAHRMAHLHVLVRRTAVIETLGACSTLCVDKTGTLTENRMRVEGMAIDGDLLDLDGRESALSEKFAALARCAAEASATTSADPMDSAVHELAQRTLAASASAPTLVREYGLTPERPVVVRVWKTPRGLHAAAKGAPETIADMCDLDATRRQNLSAQVERYAARGMRVLAAARGAAVGSELPDDPRNLNFALAGLLAFADPLRDEACDAVTAARAAGVAVAMVTGDHPATAMAIAREAGIDCSAPPLTGGEIAAADDATLRRLVASTRVFARVRPEQKLRLVRAFKDNGEVVAMTGDGVNDAPALQAAHIGLAMGGKGTDVAREAASVVLLEDDLRHLVAGIELGRRIFDNLRKAGLYITAVHVSIAGLALLPLLFGLPPALLPMHVVLIEMIIDPTCAIAFENEPVEPGTMRRPPRQPDELLLGPPQLLLAGIQGALLLAASFGLYVGALGAGVPADAARTLAFVAFTAGNLTLIRVVATRRATLANLLAPGHGAYWVVTVVAIAVVGTCILVPDVGHLFEFRPPGVRLTAIAIGLGLASTLVFDFAKLSQRVQRILGAR